MGQPVVHFEIIGTDPAKLHEFYRELFDWNFQLGDTISRNISQPGLYGFVNTGPTDLNGGVGGGPGHRPHVVFYVGVPDVETALRKAESLGGTRQMGPDGTPGTLVVGHFTDPEGNLIGVAGAR
ncbi:VOC family protein [Herbidospora sp. RD11066]